MMWNGPFYSEPLVPHRPIKKIVSQGWVTECLFCLQNTTCALLNPFLTQPAPLQSNLQYMDGEWEPECHRSSSIGQRPGDPLLTKSSINHRNSFGDFGSTSPSTHSSQSFLPPRILLVGITWIFSVKLGQDHTTSWDFSHHLIFLFRNLEQAPGT